MRFYKDPHFEPKHGKELRNNNILLRPLHVPRAMNPLLAHFVSIITQ